MAAPSATAQPLDESAAQSRRDLTWADRLRAPGVGPLLVAIAAVVALVAWRLGPALVGARAFGAFDLLMALPPWSDGGAVAPPVNPMFADSLDSLIPGYLHLQSRLLDGDLPLRQSLGGPGDTPLFGFRPVLTPTTWPLAIVPTWYALGLVKLAEVLVAITGMTMWLRRVGVHPAAGVLAGLLYCGSAFFVGWATWTPQAGLAATLPALFWAVERFCQLRTLRSAAVIAVVVAVMFAYGFPAVALHGIYAAGAYLLVRVLRERPAGGWRIPVRTLAVGAAAVAIGVALVAISLVPQLMSLSGVDLGYRDNKFDIELPADTLFGALFPGTMFNYGYGQLNLVETYAYLGAGTLVLALLALVLRSGRIRPGVVPTLAFGTLIAASVVWFHGFWIDWMGLLPGFANNPSNRLLDLIALFCCALAGIGAHRLFGGAQPLDYSDRRRTLLTCGVFAAIVVLTAWLVVLVKGSDSIDGAALFWDVTLALGSVAAIALAATGTRRIRRELAFVAVVVLSLLQVSASVANFWPLSNRDDFYPAMPILDELAEATGDDRMMALGSTLLGSTGVAYELRTLNGHTFQPRLWSDLLLAVDSKIYAMSPTEPHPTLPVVPSAEQQALLDRLAISAVLAPPNQPIPGVPTTLTGELLPGSLPAAASTTTIEPDDPLVTPVSPQGVRAVNLMLAEPTQTRAAEVTITARIVDAAGTVLGSGASTRTSFPAGGLQIAVAGEDVRPQSGLRLEVSADAPIEVETDASGGLNASFVVPAPDWMRLEYADPHGTVWSRVGVLSRIRWASSTETIPDGPARVARLADPTLPRETVVLAAPGPAAGGEPAVLTPVADTGDRIIVDVDAAADGYLVVADWMEKGWRVSVDDKPTELVSADHAFAGTFVPAGTHRVTFTYVGYGLRTGIAISAAAFVVLVGVLMWPVIGRRRARARDKHIPSGPAPTDG